MHFDLWMQKHSTSCKSKSHEDAWSLGRPSDSAQVYHFYTHIWSFPLSYGGISCWVTSVGEKLLNFQITEKIQRNTKLCLTAFQFYCYANHVYSCFSEVYCFYHCLFSLFGDYCPITWRLMNWSTDILGLNGHLIHFHFVHLLFFVFQFTSGIKICFINTLSILYTASGPLYASTCLAFLVDWIHGVNRTSTRGVM